MTTTSQFPICQYVYYITHGYIFQQETAIRTKRKTTLRKGQVQLFHTVVGFTGRDAPRTDIRLSKTHRRAGDVDSGRSFDGQHLPRDRSKYTSPSVKQNLTHTEAAFYERLDKTCVDYMNGSMQGGIKVYYKVMLNDVKYSDSYSAF